MFTRLRTGIPLRAGSFTCKYFKQRSISMPMGIPETTYIKGKPKRERIRRIWVFVLYLGAGGGGSFCLILLALMVTKPLLPGRSEKGF